MATVISPDEYPDIVVTVAHPFGDVEASLEEWIRIGPGPRPYVGTPRRGGDRRERTCRWRSEVASIELKSAGV